jgi:hypothetical protein
MDIFKLAVFMEVLDRWCTRKVMRLVCIVVVRFPVAGTQWALWHPLEEGASTQMWGPAQQELRRWLCLQGLVVRINLKEAQPRWSRCGALIFLYYHNLAQSSQPCSLGIGSQWSRRCLEMWLDRHVDGGTTS